MADIVAKPLENIYVDGDGYVSKRELRSILKKINVEVPHATTNATLEVFEVLEIKTNSEKNPQEVVGRYVYSQHGDSETNNYKPCNSNIVQFPMVGELWLGFDYKGESYYLSRLSDSNISVNYQSLGESEKLVSPGVDNTKDKKNKFGVLSKFFGIEKADINPQQKAFEEGSTLLQGRFNNYINIGSDDESRGQIQIDNVGGSIIDMGIKPIMTYSREGRGLFPVGTKEVHNIRLDAERIEIFSNDKDAGMELTSQGNILIDSDGGDIFLEAADRIRMRPRNSVIDFVTINGQKRDFANPNGDIMLPKFIKERAGDFKPLVDIIKAELLALPYLILPPTLPGGLPNPSFMIGMKIKYDVIKSYIELIKYFIDLEWLPKFDFELVNLQEVLDALGLSSLPGLDELGGFEGVLADIAGAKAKIEILKGTVDGLKSKAAVVSNQVSQIQKGEFDGSPSDFIKTLDDFESDEENPKIDTTDIREIIADGTLNSTEELTRYFQNGGSPHLAALSMEAGKRQQEVEQLDQVVKLAEISKLTQEE